MNHQTSAPGFEQHPKYQVDIQPTKDRVRILVGDQVLLDTTSPLKVTESRHHPVWYLPMADADQSLLSRTDHSSYCPFKGHASYWSIGNSDPALENSVWAYEDPYLECVPLKDYLAFYTDRVNLEVNGQAQDAQAPGWSS
jgi:uncharacterized protein (DUF427 family)